MKRILLALALVFGVVSTAQAQQKMGHINSNLLIEMMPEYQQANEALQAFGLERQEILTELEEEYNAKLEAANANAPEWTDLMLQMKQRELEELGQRIMSFRQAAQQELEMKRQELMIPIQKKAQEAINKVAKENGFSYIIDSAMLLYIDGGEDIMDLVKAELGITTPTPAAPTAF